MFAVLAVIIMTSDVEVTITWQKLAKKWTPVCILNFVYHKIVLCIQVWQMFLWIVLKTIWKAQESVESVEQLLARPCSPSFHQLSDFLVQPLQKAGGMMALVDVYCLFNRARGTGGEMEYNIPTVGYILSCRHTKSARVKGVVFFFFLLFFFSFSFYFFLFFIQHNATLAIIISLFIYNHQSLQLKSRQLE